MANLEERVAERIAEEFHVPKVMTETRRKLYEGELLTIEEAEGFLGEGTFEAYFYAHTAVEGLWRRCGNVAISHMVEVGERANSLDFGFVYVIANLLHDAVEDKSNVIKDAYEWAEDIRARFGNEAARNVATITNHYAVLIEDIERITIGTPVTGYTNNILLGVLESMRADAGESISTRFERHFSRLGGIIRELNIDEINKKISRDNRYSIFDEMKSRAYGLYIDDIFDDARERHELGEEGYDVGVIVKGMDNIDNLRTMGIDVPVMEKTLGKIEAFLRRAEKFKGYISSMGEENEGFLTVYGALKEQLVEQTIARRLAAGLLNDSRYVHTLSYLDGKINDYTTRFGIDSVPIAKRLHEQTRPLDFEVVR